LFAITLLSGQLAGWLAREELAARGSMELARQQAQLNRLVIEEMVDGVLVVDRGARVRAANPAARSLLAARGMTAAAPFSLKDLPEWCALQRSVERAFSAGLWPDDAQEIRLDFDNGETRMLQARARFTRRRPGEAESAPPEELCVLFLEDARSVQARMRQDKLAAMGRISAGIAHEIRNPLAAIAQANALMMEDELAPPQRQLAEIVSDNVGRLKRIVDDVMEVAPGAAPDARAIDAAAHVAHICAEWARTAQVPAGPDSRLQVELPAQPLGVLFDPEHMRRVLVNLLDNAHRHASDAARAIELRLAALDESRALLVVASDGAPIAGDVERHLFEPFSSSRSRGTGLGLYICRELCERYDANIEYRLRPTGDSRRNEFRVTMLRMPLSKTESPLQP
jgi:two-component system sensor histidine kinase PilS (NtrC family)